MNSHPICNWGKLSCEHPECIPSTICSQSCLLSYILKVNIEDVNEDVETGWKRNTPPETKVYETDEENRKGLVILIHTQSCQEMQVQVSISKLLNLCQTADYLSTLHQFKENFHLKANGSTCGTNSFMYYDHCKQNNRF